MNWYTKLKYHIVPPVFVVIFTSSVQLLALSGRDEDVTITALASGICGNPFAWTVVGALVLWAWAWLIIPRKEYFGPSTTYGCTPIYKVHSYDIVISNYHHNQLIGRAFIFLYVYLE